MPSKAPKTVKVVNTTGDVETVDAAFNVVLPSIIRRKRQPNGEHFRNERGAYVGKILAQCPLTVLRPGVNEIAAEHWDLIKDHKVVKGYEALRYIRVEQPPKQLDTSKLKKAEG